MGNKLLLGVNIDKKTIRIKLTEASDIDLADWRGALAGLTFSCGAPARSRSAIRGALSAPAAPAAPAAELIAIP